MSQQTAATEFASRTLEFERNVEDALVQERGVLEVRLRLPIPKVGRPIVRRVLDLIRNNGSVPNGLPQDAIRDAVASIVSDYEKAMDQSLRRKSANAAPAIRLSPFERDTIQSFVLWAFLDDQRRKRVGERAADLDSVAEALGHG